MTFCSAGDTAKHSYYFDYLILTNFRAKSTDPYFARLNFRDFREKKAERLKIVRKCRLHFRIFATRVATIAKTTKINTHVYGDVGPSVRQKLYQCGQHQQITVRNQVLK